MIIVLSEIGRRPLGPREVCVDEDHHGVPLLVSSDTADMKPEFV